MVRLPIPRRRVKKNEARMEQSEARMEQSEARMDAMEKKAVATQQQADTTYNIVKKQSEINAMFMEATADRHAQISKDQEEIAEQITMQIEEVSAQQDHAMSIVGELSERVEAMKKSQDQMLESAQNIFMSQFSGLPVCAHGEGEVVGPVRHHAMISLPPQNDNEKPLDFCLTEKAITALKEEQKKNGLNALSREQFINTLLEASQKTWTNQKTDKLSTHYHTDLIIKSCRSKSSQLPARGYFPLIPMDVYDSEIMYWDPEDKDSKKAPGTKERKRMKDMITKILPRIQLEVDYHLNPCEKKPDPKPRFRALK